MCTAATYCASDFYFGRNLDYEFSYGDEVTLTPRNYPFTFRKLPPMNSHYAIIGMAYVTNNVPLYYDAINEKGLGVAGLNFVGNAAYQPEISGKDNVAQYELIPWLLGQCATLTEARTLLSRMSMINIPYSDMLPLAQLHWLIADRTGAITVEATADGLHVYENPVGVLTNNPPFPLQMFHLNNFRALSPRTPESSFAPGLQLDDYSRGLGGLGLPGDLSSQSRFVRAAFVRMNSRCEDTEAACVSQFFHLLGAVEQQRGCCELKDGKYEITLYTSCCNTTKGIYYYTTYDNRQITAVDMHRENLDGAKLIRYPLITEMQIRQQN